MHKLTNFSVWTDRGSNLEDIMAPDAAAAASQKRACHLKKLLQSSTLDVILFCTEFTVFPCVLSNN